MLIGILSDTHGDLDGTRQAVRVFQSLEVDMVLHCGDVGQPGVVSLLSAWPVHFVLGNVDRDGTLWEGLTESGNVFHARFGRLTLEGRSIALLHGDDTTRLRGAVSSGEWDLVCHGHTHCASKHRVGKTLVINPGAISRTYQPSVAMVELPSINITHIPLA